MAVPRVRSSSLLSSCFSVLQKYPVTTAVGATAGLLAITGVVNRQLARKAQRDNPPKGQFIEVDGVRLHYVERGAWGGSAARSIPRQRQHDPGFRIERPNRSGGRELQGDRVRPPRVRP
jgi:hypothetical protein